ncbi:MAG: hypothetical protein JWL63_3239 [Rhodocyclales bacterium]|nr:hypothetical protein [Rhodocyclales bacterium]
MSKAPKPSTIRVTRNSHGVSIRVKGPAAHELLMKMCAAVEGKTPSAPAEVAEPSDIERMKNDPSN